MDYLTQVTNWKKLSHPILSLFLFDMVIHEGWISNKEMEHCWKLHPKFKFLCKAEVYLSPALKPDISDFFHLGLQWASVVHVAVWTCKFTTPKKIIRCFQTFERTHKGSPSKLILIFFIQAGNHALGFVVCGGPPIPSFILSTAGTWRSPWSVVVSQRPYIHIK